MRRRDFVAGGDAQPLSDQASEASNRLEAGPGADLGAALAAVERVFDIESVLESPRSAGGVARYFHQSLPLYLLVHCRAGAVHFALDSGDFSAHAGIIARHLNSLRARRVLEIASGTGYNAVRLARRLPGTYVTGIDLTPWHVRLARLRACGRTGVHFQCGDFHHLPFASHSFDGVCAVEGFCYAHDLHAAMSEVARVLRPGGRFIVVDGFLRGSPASLARHERMAIELIHRAFAVSRGWTLDDFLASGKRLGLQPVAVEDLTARVVADVNRIARTSRYWLTRPRRARALARALPANLSRNAIAGILLPHAVRSGAYVYEAVVLQRADRAGGS